MTGECTVFLLEPVQVGQTESPHLAGRLDRRDEFFARRDSIDSKRT